MRVQVYSIGQSNCCRCDGELTFQNDGFFIVKSQCGGKLYNKKYYRFDEIFTPPIAIGKFVSIQVSDLHDSSWANAPQIVVSYEKRNNKQGLNFKGLNSQTTYWQPLSNLNLTEIPNEVMNEYYAASR